MKFLQDKVLYLIDNSKLKSNKRSAIYLHSYYLKHLNNNSFWKIPNLSCFCLHTLFLSNEAKNFPLYLHFQFYNNNLLNTQFLSVK